MAEQGGASGEEGQTNNNSTPDLDQVDDRFRYQGDVYMIDDNDFLPLDQENQHPTTGGKSVSDTYFGPGDLSSSSSGSSWENDDNDENEENDPVRVYNLMSAKDASMILARRAIDEWRNAKPLSFNQGEPKPYQLSPLNNGFTRPALQRSSRPGSPAPVVAKLKSPLDEHCEQAAGLISRADANLAQQLSKLQEARHSNDEIVNAVNAGRSDFEDITNELRAAQERLDASLEQTRLWFNRWDAANAEILRWEDAYEAQSTELNAWERKHEEMAQAWSELGEQTEMWKGANREAQEYKAVLEDRCRELEQKNEALERARLEGQKKESELEQSCRELEEKKQALEAALAAATRQSRNEDDDNNNDDDAIDAEASQPDITGWVKPKHWIERERELAKTPQAEIYRRQIYAQYKWEWEHGPLKDWPFDP